MGGVFDPPHRGHLALASAALDALPISEVRFVISARPPHKEGAVASSPEHRRAMVEIATGHDRRLVVDDRELRREGPSYTVTTLEELRAEQPDRTLFFLVGGDNIRTIGRWFRAERIFALCRVIAMPRPGEPQTWTGEDVPFLEASELARLNADVLDAPEICASSTEIRAAVCAGDWDRVREETGPELAKAIQDLGIYRTNGRA
ncbi:MAG: nicotinate (nicotinamide) nucleotide adenylyltransferase [Planctomycetota bacterium]